MQQQEQQDAERCALGQDGGFAASRIAATAWRGDGNGVQARAPGLQGIVADGNDRAGA